MVNVNFMLKNYGMGRVSTVEGFNDFKGLYELLRESNFNPENKGKLAIAFDPDYEMFCITPIDNDLYDYLCYKNNSLD